MSKILSVELRTVQSWLSRIDKDNKEKRDCAVRDLWFSGHTQEEIAEKVGMSQRRVSEILAENEHLRFPLNPGDLYEIEDDEERLDELEKSNREAANHQTDFEGGEKPISLGGRWDNFLRLTASRFSLGRGKIPRE